MTYDELLNELVWGFPNSDLMREVSELAVLHGDSVFVLKSSGEFDRVGCLEMTEHLLYRTDPVEFRKDRVVVPLMLLHRRSRDAVARYLKYMDWGGLNDE